MKYGKKGAEILSTTMRIIGNQIISDSFLKDFTYAGRGKNENFSQYKNVCELICLCTMDAYNNFNDVNVSKTEVDTYFRTHYVRLANQRQQRTLKKKQ